VMRELKTHRAGLVLALVICGAVGTGIIRFSQHSPVDTPPTSDSGRLRLPDSSLDGRSIHPVERTARARGAGVRVPSLSDGRDSGVEWPFALSGVSPAMVGMDYPRDPVSLADAFAKAIQSGRWDEAQLIREDLLALGSIAANALKGLLHCGIEAVEVEAIRLLTQFGDAQSLALSLGRVLTVDADNSAYNQYLAAFAHHQSEAVANWIAAELGRTPTADMRARLLDLLSVLRGPQVVSALNATAASPADDIHRDDALAGLSNRRDPSETETLAALLHSEDLLIHEAAAHGLARIGSGDAVSLLADMAESVTLDSPIMALASISSSYAQETLISLAQDSSRASSVRAAAVRSLAGQPGYRVETTLRNAVIGEPSPVVSDEIRSVLAELDNNQLEAQHKPPLDLKVDGELCF
jgi:hypothetical protein